MPPRKRPAPAAEDLPPTMTVCVARLQERVDSFHDVTFPLFCEGLDKRLESMEGKLDKAVIRNGDFDKVKKMAEEWDKSALRREGAITVLRFSWKALVWAGGFAVGTGVTGSGFFWLLGRLTGHI